METGRKCYNAMTNHFIPARKMSVLTQELAQKLINEQGLDVIIPDKYTSIGLNAFINRQLSSVYIPEGITRIENNAFLGNQLRDINIPESVEIIGDQAFAYNELTSIKIPKGASVGRNAFIDNKLSKVYLQAHSYIEDGAFQRNNLYLRVYMPSDLNWSRSDLDRIFSLPVIVRHEHILSRENAKTLISEQGKNIVIPDVIALPNDEFADSGQIGSIGAYAFQNEQITSVKFTNNVKSIGHAAFSRNQLTSIEIPASVTLIESNAFERNKLTTLVIPDSITSISESTFKFNELTSVVIPDSVTVIGAKAFGDNKLTSVFIPDGVASVSGDAFESNPNLESISISANATFDLSKFPAGVQVFRRPIGNVPIDLIISKSSFNENIASGSVVATLSTADPDEGDTFSYSLVTGTGSNDNNSFSIEGNQLKVRTSPDYESKDSYSIRLKTEDSGYQIFEKSFRLSVIDREEDADTSTSPVKEWTQLLGTTESDQATSISIAADGSIYITGFTFGDLDGQINSGRDDAFISKYNSDGLEEWTQLLGTTESDQATSISTAGDGSIYITGFTYGDLDGQINSGGSDAFISKYNGDGLKEWTQLLGTTEWDSVKSISTAADGSIYITGFTYGDLDGQINSGGSDAFISKYNGDGLKEWTQLLGTTEWDQGQSISTAADGSIYIMGGTGGNLDGHINSGGSAGFITKYNSDGSKEWTQLLGASGSTIITAADGSIYQTGSTFGDLDGQTNSGGHDVFISKYNGDGLKEWTQLLGTTEWDQGQSISTAADGSIYITGVTLGDLDEQTNSGGFDIFISKYSLNSVTTDVLMTSTNVDENVSAGSVVATLSSTDEDAGDTHTYSLVNGTGSSDNGSFEIVGDQLKIKESPDFETQSSYSIRVETKDSGGLIFEKAFTLSVTDLNEDPTDLLVSASSFNENVSAGSVVSTLSSTDEDAGDTHTYSLVNGTGSSDNGSFEIVGDQLKIKESPDFETKSSYSIRVETKDSGDLTFEKSFNLSVNDLDEINYDFNGDGRTTIEHDALIGLRMMLGTFPGDSLIDGAMTQDSNQSLQDIRTFISSSVQDGSLDLDSDGMISPFTDGLRLIEEIQQLQGTVGSDPLA